MERAFGGVTLEVRLDDPWASGPLFVVAAAGAAVVLALALAEAPVDERPTALASVLLLAGLALVALAIYRLAQIVGADAPLDAAGSLTWEFVLFAAVAGVLAVRTRSAACLLVAALALGGVLLSGVSWIFDTQDAAVFRVVLVVLAYEAVLLAGGLALVAYGMATRSPGPSLLALLVLLSFAYSAVLPDSFQIIDGEGNLPDPTLVGWPIILLLAGVAALGFGILRGRHD